MLTRATRRRRYALRCVQQTTDKIQLRWLCPALIQPYTTLPRQRPRTRPLSDRPIFPQSSNTPAQRTQLRHLASPATIPEDSDYPDDYIPFVGKDSSFSSQHKDEGPLNDLSPFDLSRILLLENTDVFATEYLNADDPSLKKRGDASEIEATLDTCLHIHRWTRAHNLLSQLRTIHRNNPTRLRDAYNRVLAAMVDDFLQNRNTDHEVRINEWVEVDMKKAGLEPDAVTLALKLKVALESIADDKRDRTVRRYWNLTKAFNLESEVLSMRHTLDDRDLGRLFQICPQDIQAGWNDTGANPDVSGILPRDSHQEPALKVLETEQKGMGLASLKRSLRLFSEGEQEREQQLSDKQRQLQLEQDATEAAIARWQTEFKQRSHVGTPHGLSRGKLGAILWIWHESLAARISKELDLVRIAEETTGRRTTQQNLRLDYGPFLASLSPQKMAATTAIAMMQIFSRSGVTKPVKLVWLVTALGRAIENEYAASEVSESTQSLLKTLGKSLHDHDVEWIADSQTSLRRRNAHHSAKPFKIKNQWTQTQHAKLGAVLCEFMFDVARLEIAKVDPSTGETVTLAQPVFVRSSVFQNGKRVGMVHLHESLCELLVSQPADHLVTKQLPMVCPPKPWTAFFDGGYLQARQPFLRVKHHEMAQKYYAFAAAQRGDLDQMFAGVNVLGMTGWRINQRVFKVMLEAWNSGKEIANFPPLNKVFPDIVQPTPGATRKERWEWFHARRMIENEKGGIHSERCFQNFQMEIAKSFLDETFYLPHNVDFRGRAYPIPPYLNQMGADNCRGLLLFDQGRELGENGLRWLKIHLSNVYGYDKANLTDRAEFPMEHLDDIYDSAQKPLNGRQWWLTAEDPWQCLATCFELVSALESPDPRKYISRLPVHQDGSCNGLQHYAALGGDIAGARQVNLEPGDRPADVYSGVCELVKAEIEEEAKQGNEIAQKVHGRITRKVVKQTVMTNVYGVTFLGAIRQVRKQLDIMMPDLMAANISGRVATYIAKKIFRGLGTLFSGAHEIQYWLGDSANRISSSISPAQIEKMYAEAYIHKKSVTPVDKSQYAVGAKKRKPFYESGVFRTTVIWTTPLKLPVVQPYREVAGQSIKTNLQNITLNQPSVADVVNKRKQLQAFPPNFIHSLDATHMLLSALKAQEAGISFSAVHDSFWTHAADVDTLNTLLREAFIRMHTEDIIGRLLAEFNTRYKGHYYLAYIKKDTPLSKAILAYRLQLVSDGLTRKELHTRSPDELRHLELLREVRKDKLMASEDPKERAEGEAMVTALSLYREFDGEQYLYHRDSLGETAIGSVPANIEDAALERAMSSDMADDVDLQSTLDPLTATFDDPEKLNGGHKSYSATNQASSDADTELKDVDVKATLDEAQNPEKLKGPIPRSVQSQTWIWLPLTFRPVPQKGDFDVTRLRDSTYFFS